MLFIFLSNCSSTNLLSSSSLLSLVIVDRVGLIANIPKKERAARVRAIVVICCVLSCLKSGSISTYLSICMFLKILLAFTFIFTLLFKPSAYSHCDHAVRWSVLNFFYTDRCYFGIILKFIAKIGQ